MRADVGPCRRTFASLPAALVAATALLIAAAPARAAGCPNADAGAGEASQQALADATLCLINDEREAHGLHALSASTPLADTAFKYAAYMVSEEHFAHQDESGHNVVYRVLETDPSLDGRWDVIGENLGWGTLNMATPQAMVDGWMASPGHRANVLNAEYEEIGVGVADGAPVRGTVGALTYTTVFATIHPPPPPPKRVEPTARQCRRLRARRATGLRAARLRRACAVKTRATLVTGTARG
jgi:uncharacterized protein YkwD